jgi:hypothetical protein
VECISDAKFLLNFSMKRSFQLVSEKLSFEVTIDGKPNAEIGFDKYMGALSTIKLSTSCEQVGAHEQSLRSLKFARIQKGINPFCVPNQMSCASSHFHANHCTRFSKLKYVS